jgi:hypothetical protein
MPTCRWTDAPSAKIQSGTSGYRELRSGEEVLRR